MKTVYATQAEIPESFRGEYEERGGKFHLKVEGDYAPLIEANTKLAEFRDNNRALNTKVTELSNQLKTFEGINPADVTTMRTKIAELEAQGVKAGSDVASMIAAAVKKAVEPVQQELAARTAAEAEARAAVARTGLENQLRDVGIKIGIDERALPDYINRGTQVFKIIDGKVVARKGDQPIFSTTRPAEELGMEEWAATLQTEAPFLFKPSKGGGTGPGTGGGNGGFRPKTTISSDPLEFGRNLEGIAKGEVQVQ